MSTIRKISKVVVKMTDVSSFPEDGRVTIQFEDESESELDLKNLIKLNNVEFCGYDKPIIPTGYRGCIDYENQKRTSFEESHLRNTCTDTRGRVVQKQEALGNRDFDTDNFQQVSDFTFCQKKNYN
jgi:hypothetical protein